MSNPGDDESDPRVTSILLWDGQLDHIDYYALLGVTDQDMPLEYERAYHRFALQFHPDGHPDYAPEVRQALTRIFQRGVEARAVLSDPQLHAKYRQVRQQGALRLADLSPAVPIDLERELANLHQSCRSAGAKLSAMSAARAFQQRDVAGVKRHLLAALRFDGDANLRIEACIAAAGDMPSYEGASDG